MKLSKRELIMLIFLIILAIVFIEYRFIIIPAIDDYNKLVSQKDDLEFKVDEIKLNMAIAKKNEEKRDENIAEIEKVAARFFAELQLDALLVRTHDLVLEKDLVPGSYQFQEIFPVALSPQDYQESTITYELQDLAKAYQKLNDAIDKDSNNDEPADTVSGDQVEQYQISINATGTYKQLNDYLDALEDMQRSIIVSSISLTPQGSAVPSETELEEPEEIDSQLLSIQLTLHYYGIAKLVPQEDTFNSWYREPFVPVEYNPFTPLPTPVVTPDETTAETEEEPVETTTVIED